MSYSLNIFLSPLKGCGKVRYPLKECVEVGYALEGCVEVGDDHVPHRNSWDEMRIW